MVHHLCLALLNIGVEEKLHIINSTGIQVVSCTVFLLKLYAVYTKYHQETVLPNLQAL